MKLPSWMLWLLGALTALACQGAWARWLDDADVVETPSHYDLTVRFACPVRYVSHSPSSAGDELRVQLTMDASCGSSSTETLASPAPAIIRALELQPLLASDAQLLVRWRLSQQFLVVPTTDRLGLRIRILREGETAETRGKILVAEMPDTDVTTAYALNLESALVPISADSLKQAQQLLRGRVYTSEAEVNDQHWYRLRVGPIATRADAERLLLEAQKVYPRAWLAIADEQVAETLLTDDAGAAISTLDADEGSAPDDKADALWSTANQQFRGKNYAAAIESLTQLLARSSGRHRAAALELRGIAHERRGELALAQANFEVFLRDYAKDKRAQRVRRRLNALRTAALPGRKASGGDDNEEGVWHGNGDWSQSYRRDQNHLTVGATTQNVVGQHSLFNDFDYTARYRGIATDTRIRVSAGYNKSFIPTVADQVRVSSAFVEVSDRDRGWYGSVGRQVRVNSGSFGAFDGVMGSYQWLPHFTTDVSVGMPVDSARSGVNSQRLFESLSMNFGTFAGSWEPSMYLVNQSLQGRVDRRAVGGELRYFKPGRVLIGLVDYDLYYQQLNTAVLVGTLQLPAQWTLNLDVEQRNSPLISTRNALVGQPTTDINVLASAFNDEELKQLALDRTPDTKLYSVSLARALGERLQVTLITQRIATSATPPSEGSSIDPLFVAVEGIPAEPPEWVYSAQLLAASIMRAGDINIIGVRQQNGGSGTTTSLGLSSRVPLWRDYRFGPQLRVDRRVFAADQTTLWLYAPSMRITLQRPKLQVDLEVGAELSNRNFATGAQRNQRYFGYFGYRWLF